MVLHWFQAEGGKLAVNCYSARLGDQVISRGRKMGSGGAAHVITGHFTMSYTSDL